MHDCLAPFLHPLGECGCLMSTSNVEYAQSMDIGSSGAPLERCPCPQLAAIGLCDCVTCTCAAGVLDYDPDRVLVLGEDILPAPVPADLSPRLATVEPPHTAPVATVHAGGGALTWSEYVADLEMRGAAALEDEHGLWCPTDCSCGFVVPDEVEAQCPLLGLVRTILDPRVAAMFARADDADRMTCSLHEYLIGAWHEIEPGSVFEDGPAIKAVADHLQAQLEDRAIALGLMTRPVGWTRMRAQNLLIRIPPRSLKTVIATIAATSWAWLRWPTMRILSLSSNPRVTSEGADKVRSLIRSDWYQQTFRPTWRIREDMDALAKIGNTAGGWRAARGITSRITGEGADWLLIDDPHDGAEVYSKAKRAAVNDKWRRSTSNRVNDPRFAIRTGVMQALHFDDWGEHRIADGWGLLLIRMEYQPGGAPKRVGEVTIEPDALRVSPYGWRDWRLVDGETIHARFTPEWRAQERKDKGPLDWAAQYQQDPAPIDGGIVQASDLRSYESLPTMESWAITVDAAFKKTITGSRVSVQVWGRKGPDRFLIDNDTRPMNMVETIASIEKMRDRYPRAKGTILVEDKANGSEIIRQLREKFTGVIAVNPGNNSKEGRLYACQAYFTGHNVYLPVVAPWLEDFRAELTQFPNWPKDDQVDAMVQVLLYWRMSNAAARARNACTL